MAVNTPQEIVQSYVGLLIMQYLNKPNASGFIDALASPGIIPQTSVQSITFSDVASSGTFVLSYNDVNTASINWNDSVGTIQSKLQAVTGLGSVTVTGSIASQSLVVTFTGVPPPALDLVVVSTTLFGSVTITITITETDETLPLAVMNGFNLIAGTTLASGVQLDVIGQYVGVSRTGLGFTGTITLNDTDYLTLIRMGIILNYAGSSLSDIEQFLWNFFPGDVYVYDNLNMTMTYIVGQDLFSQDLIQLFITEGLLPVPMAVGVNVFYPPFAKLFSFRTYSQPSNGWPFNTYADYEMTWTFLDYHDLVTP